MYSDFLCFEFVITVHKFEINSVGFFMSERITYFRLLSHFIELNIFTGLLF